MSDFVECIVVGAGVVGLACARAIAQSGRQVLVLEKEPLIGSETSSRNSEVIHAGIYYPPESLKAALCVRGKDMLYDYCETQGIPHGRCEKLVVAANAGEVAALERIRQNALASGVHDLELIDGAAATRLEPKLRCHAALRSPSTGILDSHQYMLALEGDIENAGGSVVPRSYVAEARRAGETFEVVVETEEPEPIVVASRMLVNAAGLWAQQVAQRVEGMPPERIPKQYLAKGNYFVMSGKAPFSRLIYPLPTAASLGLHYSIDLGGQVRFGPDVEWVERIDYRVDATRAAAFEAAIRRYFPELPRAALQPGYAGVRPKIVGPDDPAGDFVIQGEGEHGVAGLVNLFGIESPGLTSSLAIAEEVASRLLGR